MAWHVPVSLTGYTWAPISMDEAENLEEDARKALDGVISDEVEPADRHRVTASVGNGHPADVLLQAAAAADLLVVGSRGHGAFADALLGSVSQYCVHHAHCPALVMRGGGYHGTFGTATGPHVTTRWSRRSAYGGSDDRQTP